jgi:hypothetical protein
MGVKTEASSSVPALAGEYLDAVTRGESAAAAERYFHPDIVYIVNGPPSPAEAVDLKIARYHFLENTFEWRSPSARADRGLSRPTATRQPFPPKGRAVMATGGYAAPSTFSSFAPTPSGSPPPCPVCVQPVYDVTVESIGRHDSP